MRGPNINTPPSTNRIDLAQSAHRVKSLQSYARRLLRCMSPELADSVAKLPKCRGINFPEMDQTNLHRRTM
jgi:hypothetical protein